MFGEEEDILDDENFEEEEDDHYFEPEPPIYVSIKDQIPLVDFRLQPNNAEHNEIESPNYDNENINEEDLNPEINEADSEHDDPPQEVDFNLYQAYHETKQKIESFNPPKSNKNQKYADNSIFENSEPQVYSILDLKPDYLSLPPCLNEPATIEAMGRLGFVQSDLVPPDYSQIPGNDEMRSKIVLELEKKRIQMIEEVIKERNKIITGIPESESDAVSIIGKPKSKGKKKIKGKKKGKKGVKKKKKANANNDNGEVSHTKKKPKLRRKKKKVVENDDSYSATEVSKPTIIRKRAVKKETPPDVIRKKKIEETIMFQQKKVEAELNKKIEDSEKRLKMRQDNLNKKVNENKKKRIQRQNEIQAMKKEIDHKKEQLAQKKLKRLDEVELRQAEIRRMKMEEVQKKKQLREQRLLRVANEKRKRAEEQLKQCEEALDRSDQSPVLIDDKPKGKNSRMQAKIIIPKVPSKKH